MKITKFFKNKNIFKNKLFSTDAINSSFVKQKTPFKFRPFLHTPLILLTTGGGLFAYHLYNDPSFRKGLLRSGQFWMRSFPIYMRYRYTEWKVRNESEEEKKKQFKKLHEKYAPESLKLIHDLRGFYVKMGQVMSTRSDFAPEEYMKVLSSLQDKAPPTDFSIVKKVIEDSLGKPLEEIFSHFDEVPIGSASIGQVHVATLRETGEKVVIKVQYPDVENLFRYDFSTTRTFTKLSQPESLPMMDELEKQFMTEFDFEREANSIETIRKNMHAYYGDIVHVPRVHKKYTTKKTIVMEYLNGVKLLDSLKEQYTKIARDMGLTLEELRDLKMKEVVNKKPRKISKFEMEAFRFFLWCKKMVYNSFVFLFNHSFGLFSFQMKYSQIEIPINHITLMDTLVKVHGHQILIDGVFNGDPHPGNFLLLKNSPKIGLIDFGQTKIMSIEERINLAKLVLAIADRDSEETINIFKKIGFKSKKMDPYVVETTAIFFYDRDGELMGEKNIQQFLEYLNSVDNTVSFPDQYLMAGRVSFLLRGLGTHLQYPLETSKAWRPFAEQVLETYDKEYLQNRKQKQLKQN